MRNHVVWKTLPKTEANSMEDLIKVVVDERYILGSDAIRLCRKVALAFSMPTEPVDIALVQMKDIRIDHDVPAREFYMKAIEAGYQLLTPEMGILARLAYTHREQISLPPNMWWIYIGMKPVEVDGRFMVLRIAAGTKGSRLDAVEFDSLKSMKDKCLFRL